MVINMDETKLRTIAQLQEFLDATPEVKFTLAAGVGDAERYEHISRVLKRFDYPRLKKAERGVVLAYLRRTSGYIRIQITRLVARWDENWLATVSLAKRYGAPAVPFARKYTQTDVQLLVEMDRANEDVCGPAVVHLLRRAWRVYGDPRYERLAGLSVSHLYNLRKSAGYQARRTHFTKTRPVCNPIGARAQGTTAQWACGLGAHRLRAPRRSGRHQGGLSHHLRGCVKPVAGRGLCRGHQRGILAAGTGVGACAVSV